jgi:hypothetical protein
MSRRNARLGGCLLAASFAACALCFAAPARAVLVLTLDEISGPDAGAHSVVSDPSNTQIVDTTPFGDFLTNIDIGVSNLNTPGPEAVLQIHELDIKSSVTAPVVLQITLADNGFNFPGNSGDTLTLTSAVGSTFTNSAAGDTVAFQSRAIDDNTSVVLGITPGQTITSSGGLAAQADSAPDKSVVFTRGASYSLVNVTTMTFSLGTEEINAGGTTTTLLGSNNIPEPTTAALALIGGSAMLVRRKRSGETL